MNIETSFCLSNKCAEHYCNRSVVLVVSNAEIDPVLTLPGDNNLIAVRVAHNGAVSAALPPVEFVALACSKLA